MEKEFNLKEKIKQLFEIEYLDSMADVQGDVTLLLKDFIKRLKEKKFKCNITIGFDDDIQEVILVEDLDKLAGFEEDGR